MALSADGQNYILLEKEQIKAHLGLPDDMTQWSYNERQQYNKLLANSIIGRPDLFEQDHIEHAWRVTMQKSDKPEGTGILNQTWDFAKAFVGEGLRINEKINPFMPENIEGSKSRLSILAVVGLAVVGYYLYAKR